MKTSYRAKVRYMCSEKLSASGGILPRPLTRGSAPGPRLGPSPQILRSNSPKSSHSPKLEVSRTDTDRMCIILLRCATTTSSIRLRCIWCLRRRYTHCLLVLNVNSNLNCLIIYLHHLGRFGAITALIFVFYATYRAL